MEIEIENEIGIGIGMEIEIENEIGIGIGMEIEISRSAMAFAFTIAAIFTDDRNAGAQAQM